MVSSSILIVDDHEEVRKVMHILLNDRLGSKLSVIEEAADADTARQKLSGQSFAVAVIDYMMPGTDGLSLAKEMKEHPECPKIIMLSGKSDDTTVQIIEESGAVDQFLIKPVDYQVLIDAISGFLPTEG